MPASASGSDGLHHRLLAPDRLDDRVRAESIGEFLDLGCTLVATLGDNIGRAELQRELLSILVAAHRDDALGAHLLGREHCAEAHGSIADNCDCLARAYCGRGGT